nr:hypothetical protein [uncultured bacterium]
MRAETGESLDPALSWRKSVAIPHWPSLSRFDHHRTIISSAAQHEITHESEPAPSQEWS